MADMSAAVVVSIIDQFSKNGNKFKSTLKGMKRAAGQFGRDLKGGVKAELMPRFDARNFDNQIGVLEQRVSKARSRLMGGVALALALAAPLKVAAAFDQTFKGLEKVVDAPISRLKQLRKFALETSTLVPIASRDLIELMSEAAQGGVPIAELERFSLFTAKAAIAFDMAGAQIGNRFAELRNVYLLNQQGIENLGNAINHLSNNFAAKASQITNFTNRAAGAAKILKMNAIEMSAIGAALIASGIVPETAARGVNAFAGRIVSGGKKVEGAFKMIGTSREKFLAAVKKDGAKAFTELFNSLSKSEKGMKALIDLVGTDFADDFAKLLGNPKLLEETLKAVGDRAKYAGSVIKEAASQASGAEKQWQLLVNKISATGVGLGESLLPKFLEIADGVGDMVTAFNDFATANPEFTSAATGIIASIMGLSIASRVLGFVWASTGLKLFEGMSMFVKMKDGKNIAKFAPVMKNIASVLLAIPGPLKLIGLAALAAGAAFAFLDNDTENLQKTMSKDPEGFKAWEEQLFGVAKGADAAADAIGRLNKADIAIKVNKVQEAFKAQQKETVDALTDAIETTLFDKGSDDFSDSGKQRFGPSLKAITEKIGAGEFEPADLATFKAEIDSYFGEKLTQLNAVKQQIETGDKRGASLRRLEREKSKLQGDFDRDAEVMALVKKQIAAATKLQYALDQAKAQMAEANRPKDAHDPGLPAKPGADNSDAVTVPTQRPTKNVATPTARPQRDQAGREALEVKLNGISSAARELESAGSQAGQKLGSQASELMKSSASDIGNQIGRAAADVIKKTALSVTVNNRGGGPSGGNPSSGGALHDGVD